MQTKFSEDVVPLTDLKVNPGKIVNRAKDTKRPILLTSRGRGVAVVQGLEEYENLEEEVRFLKAVAQGLMEVRDGKVTGLKQSIIHVALLVKDYDEAIEFYTQKLNFELIEDTYQPEQDKRWVLVSPPGSNGATLLLARASKSEQESFIGNQAGGRVFLFLNTDDFWRDYNSMKSKGIKFVRKPKKQDYGTVAVFEDLYGNLWDLLELNRDHPISVRSL